MNCSNCDHKLPKTGFYCGNCGSKIDKPNYIEPEKPKPVPGSTTQKLPTTFESQMAQKNLIFNRVKLHKSRFTKFAVGFTILTIALMAIVFQLNLNGYKSAKDGMAILWGGWLVVGVLWLLGRLAMRTYLNEKEYYTIPGSRNKDGYHRCIHCGGHGVARHTNYQTNSSNARCHRCQTILLSNR